MTMIRTTLCRVVGGAILLALTLTGGAVLADPLTDKITAVEARLGGRIGVAMRDLASGQSWTYKADERFPLSSTFKALLGGAVLARVDARKEELARNISFSAEDLVSYSPVTEKHVESGMSVEALCEATITVSDNSAGNLLLKTVGGPEGLTAFLRSIGDETTRLDRWETALNEGTPGDERDTTTPNAMLDTLNTLLFGDVLSEGSRKQLADWMIADQVADGLIRASLPKGWKIGDKTGAGGHGSRSIVAVIWPPEGGPVLAAIYINGNDAAFEVRNEAIAEIGAAMVAAIEAQ